MKYSFVDDGRFIQGLPASGLDDTTLTQEQQDLLKVGISLGLYVQETPTERVSRKKATDEGVASNPE